ncbi:MAG: hypothetical protein MR867_06965 [Eubacterium sp.]|nr:hypothetical protein [Eubacterium sp.]MDD7208942.1 hypothetical protein [Lachnospiraceae bacterium]MDY5496591.1 hypothetical protein [Anaerobutyricum sp.]
MRRVKHSRSGLFLIELVLCILFFSLTAAVCIRVFVRSHEISAHAQNLYQAQTEAANVAEIFEGSDSFLGDLKKYYPDLEEGAAVKQIFYNKNWKMCGKEHAAYVMKIFLDREDTMEKMKLSVYSGKNEIYHLYLKRYCSPGREENLK